MELRDYLRVLRKRWVLIVAMMLLGVIVAGGASFIIPRQYQATTEIFVSTSQSDSVTDLSTGSTFAQARVKSYVTLITTSQVLQPVIDQLGLPYTVDELAKEVSASVATNTVILTVTVTDESADQSAAIANAIAGTLPTVVTGIEQIGTTGTSPVKLSTIQPATVPTDASSPNLKLNLALGLLIGLALGVGLGVLIETLDTRIRGLRDIAQVTDATVLGGIAYDPDAQKRPLIVQSSRRSTRAESFRTLRTNVQFATLETRNSFVITSSLPSEGKTTTGANLAITMAESGQNVVYVDADLRRPKVAEYMGIEGSVGLTDVLIGRADLDDVLQEWGETGLTVLPSGQIPPNPSELLGSNAMRWLLETLEQRYDIVIFDTTPVLPVTDAALLARLTGGAIVIAAAKTTRRPQLLGALRSLANVEAHVLGIVLTKLPTKGADARGYGHYGYYGEYDNEKGQLPADAEWWDPSQSPEMSESRHATRRSRQRNDRARNEALGRAPLLPEEVTNI